MEPVLYGLLGINQYHRHKLRVLTIMKTCPCNVYRLKPHFVCRVISIFLIFAPKHKLWVHIGPKIKLFLFPLARPTVKKSPDRKKFISIFHLEFFLPEIKNTRSAKKPVNKVARSAMPYFFDLVFSDAWKPIKRDFALKASVYHPIWPSGGV